MVKKEVLITIKAHVDKNISNETIEEHFYEQIHPNVINIKEIAIKQIEDKNNQKLGEYIR